MPQMSTPRPKESDLLTPDAIKPLDSQSLQFLAMAVRHGGNYKVIVASDGPSAVVAIGSLSNHDWEILDTAVQEHFGESWTKTKDFMEQRAGSLNDGVKAQAAMLTIAGSNEIAIFSTPEQYDPLSEGIFDRPTEEVVTDFIQGALANLSVQE